MDVKDQVKDFFKENFMVEFDSNFNNDDSFLENGLIDSTGVLELVLFLEETFSIKVEDDDIIPENLDSLQNIEGYINNKKTKN
ncbi:MAG: acyl carrier protein [Calditrichae bacterium]|nr:acyl carrier protein [Calditrichia bacterium]